ncbi:Na+/H+ antiporter subunit E [soil metagenome]
MRYLILNILMAFVWVFLFAEFTLLGLLVGYVIGYAALAVSRPILGGEEYIRAVPGVFRLLIVFIYELAKANIELAREVLRPEPRLSSGFIAFEPPDLNPTETVLLANMISLTPGTLSVDVDPDAKTLFVHSVYADDPEALRRDFCRFAKLIHSARGQKLSMPEDSSSDADAKSEPSEVSPDGQEARS